VRFPKREERTASVPQAVQEGKLRLHAETRQQQVASLRQHGPGGDEPFVRALESPQRGCVMPVGPIGQRQPEPRVGDDHVFRRNERVSSCL